MIATARLILLPCDLDHYEALQQDRQVLAELLDVQIPETWPVFPESIAFFHRPLRLDPSLAGWGTWLVIHAQDRVLIGEGGFGGKPDQTGRVAIGYGIIPEYRGQGYATEFAQALVAKAFADLRVNRVAARTLPDGHASIHILQKLGMGLDGKDGEALTWSIRRERYATG